MRSILFTTSQTPPENEFDRDLEKELDRILNRSLIPLVNGGLSFEDNMNCQLKTLTTAGADTEVEVAHTLKRIPAGYIVYSRDKGGVVYDSGTAFTTTNIYIKCSTATTALKLIIF